MVWNMKATRRKSSGFRRSPTSLDRSAHGIASSDRAVIQAGFGGCCRESDRASCGQVFPVELGAFGFWVRTMIPEIAAVPGEVERTTVAPDEQAQEAVAEGQPLIPARDGRKVRR